MPNQNYSIRLINMLIAGEDHRYRFHVGFDIIAIVRAIYKNYRYGTHEGGSTIEQQYVRVLSGCYERSLRRKVKEILFAIRISFVESKKSIAWNYLNIAYYGTNYQTLPKILGKFGYSIEDELPPEVCAEVIARLKYPEPKSYSPSRLHQIEKRKSYILSLYYKYYNTPYLWKEA